MASGDATAESLVPNDELNPAFRKPCICVNLHKSCDLSTCDEAANERQRRQAGIEHSEGSSSSIGREYIFQATLGDLRRAALQGCKTCAILYTGWASPLSEDYWLIMETKEDEFAVGIEDDHRFGVTLLSLIDIPENDIVKGEELKHLEFYATQDSEFYESCRVFPRSIISTGTYSPESFACAARWIEECKDHLFCPSQQPGPLPTRVIDLGPWDEPDFQPYLLESNEIKANYVTLSHRWGTNTHVVKTTKETLRQRKSGINVSLLSKTFRDAIYIARRLQVRYLWIDSLCIIQDDNVDWQRESSKMASIYQNSLFTIAASSPWDDARGIFVHTPKLNRKTSWEVIPKYASTQLETEKPSSTSSQPETEELSSTSTFERDLHKSESGMTGKYIAGRYYYRLDTPQEVTERKPRGGYCIAVFNSFHLSQVALYYLPYKYHLRPFPEHTGTSPGVFVRERTMLDHGQFARSVVRNISPNHLMSRGWAFQERLLSARVLHYTESELVWECRSGMIRCQCDDAEYFEMLGKAPKLVLSIKLERNWDRTFKGSFERSTSGDATIEELTQEWATNIIHYSARHLSHSSDRLPALSGLAKRFHEDGRLGIYLAGLWSQNLPRLLTWSVGFSIIGFRLEGRRADSYVAPTWSWASVIGGVWFVTLANGMDDKANDKSEIVGRVLDAICTPAGLDPTGAVSGGWLTVSGQAIQATLRLSQRRIEYRQPVSSNTSDNSVNSDSEPDPQLQGAPLEPNSDSEPDPHVPGLTLEPYKFKIIHQAIGMEVPFNPDCLSDFDILTEEHPVTCLLWSRHDGPDDFFNRRVRRHVYTLASHCLVLRQTNSADNTYTRIGLLALPEFCDDKPKRGDSDSHSDSALPECEDNARSDRSRGTSHDGKSEQAGSELDSKSDAGDATVTVNGDTVAEKWFRGAEERTFVIV